MSVFKRIMMGFVVMSTLAACEEQQIPMRDKEHAQAKKQVEDVSREDVPSNKAAKYNGKHLYGNWIKGESFLLIARDQVSNFTMQRITRSDYEKEQHFEIAEPVDNNLTGILYNENQRNRTTTFTLKLNEDYTELTITMPNESPVTYKQTEIEPEEFNPTYKWR
ncbi:hypothetical protein ACQKL5_07750 [Peribacillus sp. NPDC097675]|uniref:hypothetical protein n=1 Tax=Peribacillus sp. NPDC097675 TaxID=3390618 RepID=UPI003D06C04F